MPDLFDQLVHAHQAIPVLDEEREHRIDLRLERAARTGGAQLDFRGIQLEPIEAVDHVRRIHLPNAISTKSSDLLQGIFKRSYPTTPMLCPPSAMAGYPPGGP